MKKFLLGLIFFALALTDAKAQLFQWAKSQEKSIIGSSLASGSTILATTGVFDQQITLGNQTFSSPDSNNSYLAVHDYSGLVLWAKQIKSMRHSRPAVSVDASQNVIISGIYEDSLQIGSFVLKAPLQGAVGVYVAKFNASGTLLWVRSSDYNPGNSGHFSGNLNPSSITCDNDGNIFVAGSFSDTLIFNGTSVATSPLWKGAFLVKYSPAGSFQWLKQIGSPQDNAFITVKSGRSGNLYFANRYFPIMGSVLSAFEIYKISQTGTIIWSQHIDAYVGSVAMDIDEKENIYTSGYYEHQFNVAQNTLTANLLSCFLTKMDANGNWKWAKNIATGLNTLNQGGDFTSPLNLSYNAANYLAISGNFSGTALFNNLSIATPPGFQFNTYVARIDTSGIPSWVNTVTGSNSNYSSALVSDNNGNFFLTGGFFQGNANFSGNVLTTLAQTESYLAKIGNEANMVSGTVFVDVNGNGVLDAPDKPYSQKIVETTPNQQHAISGPDGVYRIYLPAGNSTISLLNLPKYHAGIPSSHTINFTGTNQTQSGKDFVLQPIPNSNDVRVAISSNSFFRPGFTSRMRLTFHNSGTTTLSDTVKLAFNPANLIYNTASTLPLSATNGKLAWYYQNLQPQETRNIDIDFTVNPATLIGTVLTTVATIKPLAIDLFQDDNADTLKATVTGSYDPNDKQVDKKTISPAVAASGTYLNYIIRFQNTGTDTAFTVLVTDKITSKLNLGDFEMVAASHPYKLSLESKQLEWRFDNILLPDSNRNEAASHGFIRFRIKTKPGLSVGDSIANQASIYFDFNSPVITNYAVTKIADPASVKESKSDLQNFSLYPNPARNYVTVAADLKKQTTATVTLVNLLGQTISRVTLPESNFLDYKLPLNNLPKGIYVVQLETETGVQAKRLVIQ